MRRLRRIRRLRRSGTTLVEMIVTLLLFGIMMTMAIGILSPAAKVFVRIQRLHNAQIILENTVQELRGLTRSAAGNIKIYDHCGAAADPVGEQGVTGDIGGLALEFVNEEGYIILLSTEGCPATKVQLGDKELDTIADGEVESGRLLARYYVRNIQGEPNGYYYRNAGGPNVRAFTQVFADGYYMGNYIEIKFSYPPGTADGASVKYLNADLRLYADEAKTDLIARDSVTLDLRYDAKRYSEATAQAESSPGP